MRMMNLLEHEKVNGYDQMREMIDFGTYLEGTCFFLGRFAFSQRVVFGFIVIGRRIGDVRFLYKAMMSTNAGNTGCQTQEERTELAR